jgi:hypothetical protein
MYSRRFKENMADAGGCSTFSFELEAKTDWLST